MVRNVVVVADVLNSILYRERRIYRIRTFIRLKYLLPLLPNVTATFIGFPQEYVFIT